MMKFFRGSGLLVSCLLCGCAMCRPNSVVEVFDTMEFEFNRDGTNSSLKAFYEVYGSNVVIDIVNNTTKVLVVDTSAIEYNCTIKYVSHGGEIKYQGGMSVSRCGPCEFIVLSPLRYPENNVFENNSTTRVNLTLAKETQKIEKVFFQIPCVDLKEFAHCNDYEELERLLWNRRIWVEASFLE